ncbi:MAG TPA: hypothetical protein IGS53_04805 [Leptolyngbyaceae cyanobacterium M33_DOE_097]|uniref:Uncharacterized protein n=1 Tax=Oscillatoriales cyanobacterium SpSt-418 TaxID=2282169 RepID=A0A7C3KF98_9CYAN|nr:hypothetical protein [Leptolyngbyaceae cyanobacterium M33_DOE_097]
MRTGFDFDDITDWLADNKLTLGILALGGFAAISMFIGGGYQQLQAKLDRESGDNAAAENQARAEKIFAELGCSAQVIDAQTRTANLRTGSFVIDPMSVTRTNPKGTAIASGYVCSLDGSIFEVKGGTAFLVGTSPRIRQELVKRGIPSHVEAMTQHVNRIYGDNR